MSGYFVRCMVLLAHESNERKKENVSEVDGDRESNDWSKWNVRGVIEQNMRDKNVDAWWETHKWVVDLS